ncbi:uncharacterized protein KZ484_011087 [Pholidichthys leucotaenia]
MEELKPSHVKEEQEEPEPPEVKEEQDELCITQEGEQLVVKLEADTFMVTVISEENQHSEAEPNSEQLFSPNSAGTEIQDEEVSWFADSGSTKEEEPKPKKRRRKTGSHSDSDDDSLTSEALCGNETDAPQLHDYKAEVLTVHQLYNQERNSCLNQEEQDAAQFREEELCTTEEEEHFELKRETDAFMVSPTEDKDSSETQPNSEQLPSHNSPDTESQDQGTDSMSSSEETIIPTLAVLGALSWDITRKLKDAQVTDPDPGVGPLGQLFVPAAVKGEVVHWMYTVKFSCHPGVARTLAALHRIF